jgi:hypothetical protein
MMPTYVYPSTPDSLAYQLMLKPQMQASVQDVQPMPDEYQPISLAVEEDLDDIFIEPSITATYFAMVDLQIGGTWLITDADGRGLYACKVASKDENPAAGTVTYRFNTLMTRLSSHEPAGLLISAADALGTENATPNQVLSYLFSRWASEVQGLSLMPNPPTFELRGASGPIIPYVIFLSVAQTDQPLSIREWVSRFFEVFEGYSYRMDGSAFTVIPPAYQQLEAIDLGPALVLSENVTQSDAALINSQTVRHRPYVLNGEFLKNTDGTPAQELPGDDLEGPRYANLPEVAEPSFYRQGATALVPLPDNRRHLRNGEPAPYLYSDDLYPVVPPVRVTWTAYVFGSRKREDGSIDRRDVSEHIIMQTHVIDIGPEGAYFDAVTRFERNLIEDQRADAKLYFNWVWRISVTKRGVRAVLVEPAGNPTYTGIMRFGIFDDFDEYEFGAEFHLNVQAQAWERSEETYSATYGVYTPPTLPPGVQPPPVETATDLEVGASASVYGRRPGPEKVIDIWSLVSSASGGTGAVNTDDEEARRELISRTLLDIAQHAVKERLLPYEALRLSLMRPFPVSVREIGRLASYGARTGVIRSYSYAEAHTMQGSDVGLTLSLRVPQTTERQPITLVPITPPGETAYLPPGYPPDGDFPGEAPPEPPAPITAGPGMVQLDFGRRFDLLKVQATGERRIRLYRTDAARTGDASRPPTEMTPEGVEVLTEIAPEHFGALILEARLPLGDSDTLDLHAVLGHTPEGVVYANIEGGPVTFYRFTPVGTEA